jgi:hypothetical protein
MRQRGEACGVGRCGPRGERGGGWAKGEGREGSWPKEKKKNPFLFIKIDFYSFSCFQIKPSSNK